MKKALLLNLEKSSFGGLKVATELEKSLTLYKKFKVIFFTNSHQSLNQISKFKISISKMINRVLRPIIYNKYKMTNTFPQILKVTNFKSLDFDLVLVNYIYEFLSIKDIGNLKKPTIIFIHDMWFLNGIQHFFDIDGKKNDFRDNLLFKIVNKFFWHYKKKKLIESNHLIFAPSSNWLKNQMYKIDFYKNFKIKRIFTPVDTLFWKKMNKRKCRKKFNFPTDKKIILFIAKDGLLNFRKGGDFFESIIKKYKKQKNFLFVVLGQSRNNLSNTYNNVKFFEFRNRNRLRDLYNASDLILCLSRFDNIPYTIIESMSCGLPSISFDVGGVKEVIIHKKNGWILNNKSIQNIHNAINWCLKEKNYFMLSSNSISKIKDEFSYKKISNEVYKLYKINNYEKIN